MIAVRGRRQAGKSRLITQFVETAGVPYLFSTAVKNASPAAQVGRVYADMRTSTEPLPNAPVAFAAPPTTWTDLLARLPLAVGDGPAIVVLDEFSWATQVDDTLEGVLQVAWDRHLQALPILVVLVGSDIAMMERLTEHDRPLYGRASEMVVRPLSPAEVAEAFGETHDPVDVLDVYLATGGYPRMVLNARRHRSASDYVAEQLADDTSPLAITGVRMLDAEFRGDLAARTVLEAIGAVEVGHATFTSAVVQLGGDSAGTTLTRALPILLDVKRVVAKDTPVGASASSKLTRYRISDPYLRFWFRYCAPHLDQIARGRSDLAIAAFERDFSSWRGKAIEPVVHEAVWRLARNHELLAGVEVVGAWWDRGNTHEYDVVAATQSGDVTMIGTVKWRPNKSVTTAEVGAVSNGRAHIPKAAAARILAVCPAGVTRHATADLVLDAADIVSAYR